MPNPLSTAPLTRPGRDSPSIYKTLAADVRRLRNILEEVEELLAEDQTNSAVELKVTERVLLCKCLLDELDVTLHSYRCSTHKLQNVKPETIASLKSDFENATDSLSAAFDVLTHTGQIELRLDTTAVAVAGTFHLQSTSTSTTTASSRHDRKSSHASSSVTPSQASGPDGASSSQSELGNERSPSDEKEVFDMSRAYLLNPSLGTPWSPSGDVLDWRSPFASPDPLSVDIDTASSLLLHTPETWAGRSSVSSASSGVFVDAQPSPSLTTVPSPRFAERIDGVDKRLSETPLEHGAERPAGLGISVGGESTDRESAASSNTDNTVSHFVDETAAISNNKAPGNAVRNDAAPPLAKLTLVSEARDAREGAENPEDILPLVGLLPNVLEERLNAQLPEPPSLDLPISRFHARTAPKSGEEHLDSHDSAPFSSDTLFDTTDGRTETDEGLTKLGALVTELALVCNGAPIGRVSEASCADNPILGMKDDSPYLPAVPAAQISKHEKDLPLPPPPPPIRAPPPPPSGPPSPRSRPRPPPPPQQGRYRIMNPSLPTRTDSGSSEAARSSWSPSSSALAAALHHTRAVSQEIPTIQVEADDEKEGVEDTDTDRFVASDDTPPHRPPKVEETDAASDERPPILPPRPARYKAKSMYDLRPSAMIPSFELHHVPRGVADLELDERLHARRSDLALRPRKSADETLDVRGLLVLSAEADPALSRSRSVSAPQQTDTLPSQGEGMQVFNRAALDEERVANICRCWNSQLWEEADAFLNGHVESMEEQDNFEAARRARHLRGVSASFQGLWRRAIGYFVSVLSTPVRNIETLDRGDFAAAYWLGDAYALLNRRTESLLAYSLAEQIHARQSNPHAGLHHVLSADQEAVRLGLSKSSLDAQWAKESDNGRELPDNSILDPSVIIPQLAKFCLDQRPRYLPTMELDFSTPLSRASALYQLGRMAGTVAQYRCMTIKKDCFDAHTPWPFQYDPFFSMAQVKHGRLLAYECDLLDVFSTNPAAKLPKSGPIGPSRLDCFTCNDFDWLIRAVRDCLTTFEMEWSEVANVEGVWFLVRYDVDQCRVMTPNYFSIAVFKMSMRARYGVEVCPDGVRSARVVDNTCYYPNGVLHTSERRIRKLVRDHLVQAHRDWTKSGKRVSTVDGLDVAELGPLRSQRSRASMSLDRPLSLAQAPEMGGRA